MRSSSPPQLIEAQSGKFEPKTMRNQFAEAMREYLKAKVEKRTPEVTIAPEGKPTPPVINIMAALKESMQARGAKVRDAVRKRNSKGVPKFEVTRTTAQKTRPGRTAH